MRFAALRIRSPARSRLSRSSTVGNGRGTTRLLRRRLRGSSGQGSREVRTWLEPKQVLPERAFVETVCLVRHLEPLPEGLRGPFVDRVLARTGEPLVLDYVRLNMTAVRAT